jgi:hypothetical protein
LIATFTAIIFLFSFGKLFPKSKLYFSHERRSVNEEF